MAHLSEQCIWVTGASSGIGRALAIELAEAGNFVIASGRNEQALNQLALQAKGRITPLVFDVTTRDDALKQIGTTLAETTDYLDGVICCAGVCEYEDTLAFKPDMYERVIDANFLGVVRTLNLAMPLLKRSKSRPFFAAVGSLSSVVGLPRAEAYGASKAAVEYFIRTLNADCINLPLDAHVIRPGFVQTSLTAENDFPMPFLLTAEQAAQRIVKGIKAGKRVIDFPRRLSWPLRLARLFYPLWLHLGAPKITRHHKSDWAQRKPQNQ